MFGCCLGVNRNLIDLAMPFPEKASSHDLWLGYVAFHGKIFNDDKIITHNDYIQIMFSAKTQYL